MFVIWSIPKIRIFVDQDRIRPVSNSAQRGLVEIIFVFGEKLFKIILWTGVVEDILPWLSQYCGSANTVAQNPHE